MRLKRIQEIILRYLKGGASAIEKKAMQQWLDHMAAKELPHTEVELTTVREEMKAVLQSYTQNRKKTNSYLRVWRTVAAVAAVLVIGFFLSRHLAPTTKTYVTQAGETKTVTLGDGSVVHLRENSRLSIAPGFGKDSIRQVELAYGQASFAIQKDPEHPFVVSHAFMETKVLGTTFTIYAPESQENWSIRVNSGRVQVSKRGAVDSYTLGAADSLSYTADEGINTYLAQSTSSRSGRQLQFKDATLDEIAQTLQQHYPYDIEIVDKRGNVHRVSGEFFSSQPIEEILEIICIATDSRYEIHGGRVIIRTNNQDQ